MQNKQLLTEIRHETTVTAYGTDFNSVTGKIFQLMRKQIFAEIGKPIIQMESEEVYFENVNIERRTERFMFFFWPREKVSYTVTARIVVKIKYLDIEKGDF